MAEIKGGDKFEAAMAQIIKQIGDEATLKVGFLEGATYPDGTLVAAVAAANNFGTDRIPPRPFFSNMVRAKSKEWGPALAIQLAAGKSIPQALAILGEGIRGQLQQSIRDTNSPPLAESTIRAKGFDKPLIDTAHMINSVDYEVNS